MSMRANRHSTRSYTLVHQRWPHGSLRVYSVGTEHVSVWHDYCRDSKQVSQYVWTELS